MTQVVTATCDRCGEQCEAAKRPPGDAHKYLARYNFRHAVISQGGYRHENRSTEVSIVISLGPSEAFPTEKYDEDLCPTCLRVLFEEAFEPKNDRPLAG